MYANFGEKGNGNNRTSRAEMNGGRFNSILHSKNQTHDLLSRFLNRSFRSKCSFEHNFCGQMVVASAVGYEKDSDNCEIAHLQSDKHVSWRLFLGLKVAMLQEEWQTFLMLFFDFLPWLDLEGSYRTKHGFRCTINANSVGMEKLKESQKWSRRHPLIRDRELRAAKVSWARSQISWCLMRDLLGEFTVVLSEIRTPGDSHDLLFPYLLFYEAFLRFHGLLCPSRQLCVRDACKIYAWIFNE